MKVTSRIVYGSGMAYWQTCVQMQHLICLLINLANFSNDLFCFDYESQALGPMQEGLKSYMRRHQLDDGLGETVKALLESYNISESIEQLQLSGTISHVPEDGTRSSDDDVHSSSSTIESRKLKPRSLNSTQLTPSESTKKETCQKSNPGSRLRGKFSTSTNTTTPRPSLDKTNNTLVKKSEKPSKQEPSKGKGVIKKQGKKSDVKEGKFPNVNSNICVMLYL